MDVPCWGLCALGRPASKFRLEQVRALPGILASLTLPPERFSPTPHETNLKTLTYRFMQERETVAALAAVSNGTVPRLGRALD